jgi:hypothetical protein
MSTGLPWNDISPNYGSLPTINNKLFAILFGDTKQYIVQIMIKGCILIMTQGGEIIVLSLHVILTSSQSHLSEAGGVRYLCMQYFYMGIQ